MCLYVKTYLNVRKKDPLQLAQENRSHCENTSGAYGRKHFMATIKASTGQEWGLKGHAEIVAFFVLLPAKFDSLCIVCFPT